MSISLSVYVKKLPINLDVIYFSIIYFSIQRTNVGASCAFICRPISEVVLIFRRTVMQVDAFKQHYVEYCANTNASIEVLSAWLSDPTIMDFLNGLNKQLHKPLGLGPELLKPVQRILKYPLLLKVTCGYAFAKSCGRCDLFRAFGFIRVLSR